MNLELTPKEADLLLKNLHARIQSLDAELVRTDKRDLQHELALEIESLGGILSRLRAGFVARG